MKKTAAIAWLAIGLIATLAPTGLAAQDRRVTMVQRYDLRRSDDGRYTGLIYGFKQSVWSISLPDTLGRSRVQASWFLTEDSLQDQRQVAKPLAQELQSRFYLLPDGSIKTSESGPAPFQRGFPASLPATARPGTIWEASAQLVVDPRGTGTWTTIPLYIQFKYLKDTVWNGRPVAEVTAKYAIRYRQGLDPKGDQTLTSGSGSRESTIYLDPVSRFPVFVREQLLKETWGWNDGKKIAFDGFILTFYEGWADSSPLGPGTSGETLIATAGQPAASPESSLPPTLARPPSGELDERDTLATSTLVAPVPSLQEAQNRDLATQAKSFQLALDEAKVADVSVQVDPRGLAMDLGNLHFVADSAQLLPGENGRLDSLAKILSAVPKGRNFLVIGHTAAIGTVESQKQLSVDRAARIINELKKRGLDAGRFLYDGRGGTEPIASNDTEAGKAANRRVQIIVLE